LIDAGVNLSPLDALPFTEEVGRWAMIDGLAPGDYKVNFGGTIAPVKDPVTGTPIFGDFSDPTNPKPVIVNTTVRPRMVHVLPSPGAATCKPSSTPAGRSAAEGPYAI
jgi:hypothetical protein